jgi:hypothetical protein
VHPVVGALALFAEHMQLEALECATADQLFDAMVADHAVADDDQSSRCALLAVAFISRSSIKKKKAPGAKLQAPLPVLIR